MTLILRHSDLEPNHDPMGESLLTSISSFKVWIPEENGIVLGNSQKPEVELNLHHVHQTQIPIYKRKGGGGSVLLSPQGLCYGIRFKKNSKTSIHDYFEMGTSILQNVLHTKFNLNAEMRGISDLAIDKLKILGCSLYLPKGYALFLASVLVEDESELIEKLLAHPSREPDYRKGRTHSEFITSIWDSLSTWDKDTLKNPRQLQLNLKGWLEEEISQEWASVLHSPKE